MYNPLRRSWWREAWAEITIDIAENIGAILRAAGTDYKHVVTTTVRLADIADISAVDMIYGAHALNLACVHNAQPDEPENGCLGLLVDPLNMNYFTWIWRRSQSVAV